MIVYNYQTAKKVIGNPRSDEQNKFDKIKLT